MSSSTNPPITQSRRYQFDLDFEEERVRLEALRQEESLRQAHSNDPVTEAIAPTFSELELSQARQESFQLGYDQGLADAKKSIEKQVGELAERMITKLRFMLDQEDKRTQTAKEMALRTSVASLKRLWPQFMQALGAETVEETIRQAMEMNNQETRIVVRVHDTLLDAVVKALPHLQEQQAFSGKVIVLADESVLLGDCKVEWADGGLERLSRTLSQQLDHVLDHLLATISSSNEQIDSERTSS